MRYGLVLSNLGNFGDPRLLADLAVDAEAAGWDGFFVWDTVQMTITAGMPTADAWVTLAAIATRTERIRFGVRVAALPRHRPWLIAQQAVTLDHLSGGRMVLGVGAGDAGDAGFAAFGEPTDAKARAALLDESLAIIDGLWSGETFSFAGDHYSVEPVRLLPRPVQRPRIPVWVAGMWPRERPLARAAQWDGINPFASRPDAPYDALTPDEVGQMLRAIAGLRPGGEPFDVVTEAPVFAAREDAAARERLAGLAAAGVTWALADVGPHDDIDAVRAGILAGPPSVGR